ncbi:Zwei Ig domain protein zig-8 [Nymphon striatum]|nr:Zwei Ig domain protein zig-8 [Nymphon striatum]
MFVTVNVQTDEYGFANTIDYAHLTALYAAFTLNSFRLDHNSGAAPWSMQRNYSILESPIRVFVLIENAWHSLICGLHSFKMVLRTSISKMYSSLHNLDARKMLQFLDCSEFLFLKCNVTWVRQKDLHILTVGKFTYSNDQRFVSFHSGDDWTLQIKYPNKTDEGTYECQISTVPKMSFEITLNVIGKKICLISNVYFSSSTVPTAKIVGGSSLFIKSGSTIKLTCLVQNGPASLKFVFWYHDDEVIDYESERGGISVDRTSSVTKSTLTIRESHSSDSGNYTCQPSNAQKAITRVHILNAERICLWFIVRLTLEKKNSNTTFHMAKGTHALHMPLRMLPTLTHVLPTLPMAYQCSVQAAAMKRRAKPLHINVG